jgi:hypothetical protein
VENLVPWVSFNLRKSEFCVVGIHAADFLTCWSTKNLYNLDKLIHCTFTRKERLEKWTKKMFSSKFAIVNLIKKNSQRSHKQEITWPRSNSARTHPADHISIDVVYSVAPNISSGAR